MKTLRPSIPAELSFSRRNALRTLALAFGAASLPGWFARQQLLAADAPPEIKGTTIGENLTLITGAGGNMLVLNGADGGVVVDSGIPETAVAMASQVARVAPKLNLLINTHWHFDHAGGNAQLARAGAKITAHENTLKRLSSEQTIEFFNRKMPASPEEAWPKTTFTAETKINLNGEDLRLVPVPPAHTDGDVIVRLEKANVVHMGDLYFQNMYPFIDYSSRGWIGGMVEAVKLALPLTDAKTKIIPGHGPVGTQEDLKTYLAFLETIYDRFAKLKAAGKSVDEAVAATPTKDFDEKLGGSFFKPEQFVRFAYTGLLKHQ
jgi:glyoxylase-like metal-dependent hydrolase (beta-lactamase superfamily II)